MSIIADLNDIQPTVETLIKRQEKKMSKKFFNAWSKSIEAEQFDMKIIREVTHE